MYKRQYPIAPEVRADIQGALTWLSGANMKNKTWVSTDKNEVLFAYPSHLPENLPSFTALFKATDKGEQRSRFESEAEAFSEYLTKTKDSGSGKLPGQYSNICSSQVG